MKSMIRPTAFIQILLIPVILIYFPGAFFTLDLFWLGSTIVGDRVALFVIYIILLIFTCIIYGASGYLDDKIK